MNRNFPIIISEDTITMFADGKTISVHRHPNTDKFEEIKRLVSNEQYELALQKADTASVVHRFVQGDLKLENYVLTYKGEPVNGVIAERIVGFATNGVDVKPVMRFLEKLLSNPSKRALDELYKFLEHKFLPISTDGNFLAYKAVRNDWKDKHSGVFDNSIGNTVQITRNKVDDNCNHACSYGLHVGSLEYVSSFACGYGRPGGDHIVIVSVNPADVVSVPLDSRCQKVRCCKYKVIAEYTDPLPDYYTSKYDEYLDDEYLDDMEDEDDWNDYYAYLYKNELCEHEYSFEEWKEHQE